MGRLKAMLTLGRKKRDSDAIWVCVVGSSAQLYPNGGQFDVVHGAYSYVQVSWRKQGKYPPEKYSALVGSQDTQQSMDGAASRQASGMSVASVASTRMPPSVETIISGEYDDSEDYRPRKVRRESPPPALHTDTLTHMHITRTAPLRGEGRPFACEVCLAAAHTRAALAQLSGADSAHRPATGATCTTPVPPSPSPPATRQPCTVYPVPYTCTTAFPK